MHSHKDMHHIQEESAKWHAQYAHVPYVPYVPYVSYVPYVPMRPTCPTCPRVQVFFTDRKIKNSGFNEIK